MGRAVLWAVALLAIANAPPVRAQQPNASPPPISLEQFAEKNDLTKPAGIQFVSLRCGALHLFSAGMLATDSPDMAARFNESAKMFITMALSSAQGGNEFVRDQVERMTLMYSERARAAKANTGNVFDDPIVREDILFCKRVTG